MVANQNISSVLVNRQNLLGWLFSRHKKRRYRNASASADTLSNIQQPDISSLKSYCHQITLNDFCDCLIDGNYTVLGNATKEQQHSAWVKIQAEYAAGIGDAGYSFAISLLNEINVLEAKIMVIKTCVMLMEKYYLPIFGNILDEYKLRYTWEYGTDEYWNNLRIILSSTKTIEIELVKKRKQWDSLKEDDKKIDRIHFEDTLNVLSEMQGYNLTMDIKVSQYISLIKKLKQKTRDGKRNK